MTTAPLASAELDQLDQLGAKAFDGFLVRKDLVRKYSRHYPVPTYVGPSRHPQRFLHGRGAQPRHRAVITTIHLPAKGWLPL